MDKHRGQLVEYIVRKKYCSISELAIALDINRKSIYNWFQTKHLDSYIIYRIGKAIEHDFSVEFPELFHSEEFKDIQASKTISKSVTTDKSNAEASQWKDKYLNLLEMYNGVLLTDLNRISNSQEHS